MRHTIAKETAMSAFIAAFVSIAAAVALPALAAEEPDAVYAKYHRAAVTRDLDEMLRYASAAQRNELSGISAAQKDAAMKMLAASMPRVFVLGNKTLSPDGQRARLLVSGPGGSVLDARSETLFGTITMVNERGEWKVAAANWTNTAPPGVNSAPAVRAAPGAAPKTAAPAPRRGAALVGSTSAPPERKLGTAREPCVYKPVMTAEDIQNCK
jgi:hypothetical protein